MLFRLLNCCLLIILINRAYNAKQNCIRLNKHHIYTLQYSRWRYATFAHRRRITSMAGCCRAHQTASLRQSHAVWARKPNMSPSLFPVSEEDMFNLFVIVMSLTCGLIRAYTSILHHFSSLTSWPLLPSGVLKLQVWNLLKYKNGKL